MAAISTTIAAVALATTAVATYQQQQAASDARDARKEGQAISSAQGRNQQREQRRQQIREERIRRARIMSSAENTGVSGSSSQTGSLGALSTNVGASFANTQSGNRAAAGITSANQSFADAQSKSDMWGSIGQMSGTVFSAAGGFGSFGQSTAPGAGQTQGQSAGLYNYQFFNK